MTSPPRKLSIVCPAYEEKEVLPAFHAELCAVLDTLGPEYSIEIVYVDDGSRDGTLEVLRELAKQDHRARYLSLSRNFGKEAALTAGLEHARGDVVITLDTDLQHPPALIPTLLERWREGHDIVFTLRQDDPQLGPFKRLTSQAFHRLMRWLSDSEVSTDASDYRLMSRKAVDGLLSLRETHRFLRSMVSWLGFPATTVLFQVASRGGGVSKFTLGPLLKLACDGMLSFSKVPLRLSLLAGLVVGLLGPLVGAAALATALLGAPLFPAGVGAILVAVLVVGGLVLCGLGIVGEYVGRIYEEVKGRPLYLLKEALPSADRPAGLASADRASPGGPRNVSAA